jgi:transglutaminase-like putative cysteine protease
MSFLWRYLKGYQTIVWLTLLSIAGVTVLGIAETVVNFQIPRLLIMTLLALLFGALAATARIPGWLSILAILTLGLEYLLLFWARLGEPIWGLSAQLGAWLVYLMGQSDHQPAPISLAASLVEINHAWQVLVTRFMDWWLTVGAGPVIDPLMPQLVWGLAIWVAVGFLSWSTWKRHQAFVAVFPVGFLLGLAAFFSGELYREMTFFLLLIIILQASSQGLKRQHSWQARRIDYAGGLSQDLAIAIIPLALVISGLAFVVPTISIGKIAQTFSEMFPWDRPQTEAVVSSFGLRQAPNPFQRAGLTGLPRSHLLGNSPELGKQWVMSISTGELAPVPYIMEENLDVPRHYWQSVTYERYTSAGWNLSTAGPVTVQAETPLYDPQGPGRKITQVVERGDYAGELLHTGGTPISVDRRVEASYRAENDLAVATLKDKSYVATSWVTDASPERLRLAGTNYPEYIKRTYLQLPRTLPDRVRDLALQITATEPTSYDKAIALEAYLREYPYNLEVETPPPGRDVADYFLFELKEGYCDYYATSMVVMARAIGLPARFVIGYVNGVYDALSAEYIVTEDYAHSWAQIYFPGVGWVNFEPTAGRPAISRTEGGNQTSADLEFFEENPFQGNVPPGEGGSSGGLANLDIHIHPFWWALVGIVALFIVVNFDYWRLRFLKPKALTNTLYRRLVTKATQIGLAMQPGYTPYEFARKFMAYIEQEIHRSRLARFRVGAFWRREIQPIDEPSYRGVLQLARVFVHQQYGPPGAYDYDRDDLLIIWEDLEPHLRRAFWIIRLTRRYSKLLRK